MKGTALSNMPRFMSIEMRFEDLRRRLNAFGKILNAFGEIEIKNKQLILVSSFLMEQRNNYENCKR